MSSSIDRRTFLASTAYALMAATAPPSLMAATAPPRKIAAVMTVYRQMSHADVIVGKYLEGYRQDGRAPAPRSRIVSMFTAQVPEDDMSRAMARKHGVPIFPTIYETLTLGGDQLAVDGVLLIGEHGDYPTNEKGQKLYPRFEMFLEITDVFRRSGRSVPVFNDKHLSYSWVKARRMVEISRELNFPMMAGSSAPVAYREPALEVPWDSRINKAVAISYSGLDIYGFHLLEALQCMVERRRGGETGVAAVECLQYEAVWEYLKRTPWAKRLFDAALSRSESLRPGDLPGLVKEPTAFLIHYRDGLAAAAFLLTGAVKDFTVAVDVEGRAEPVSTLMWNQHVPPYHHFACLVKNIEKMFETGRPSYPVERTLLTSGMLDFALESRIRGYRRLETPQLAVCYRAPRESRFCRQAPRDPG